MRVLFTATLRLSLAGILLLGISASFVNSDEYLEMQVYDGYNIQTFNVADIDSILFEVVQEYAACCIGYNCTILSESACTQSGGVFYSGQNCTPNPCPLPPEAVCCSRDGLCSIRSEEDCESLGSTWHPEWDSCDPDPCEGWAFFLPGEFMMGSPEDEPLRNADETEHEVLLTTPFEMFEMEVTNQQYIDLAKWAYDLGYCTATSEGIYDALDGSTVELLNMNTERAEIQFDGEGNFYLRESPSSYAQTAYPGGYDPSNHPVHEVSWYGAAAYCDWLSLKEGLTRAYNHSTWLCNGNDPYNAVGYRLPTEAEWEHGCRFITIGPFSWGDCLDAGTEANYDGNYPYPNCPSGVYVGWTVPVRSQLPSWGGLYGIHGNLWEWCNDWYGSYGGDETDPIGPTSGPGRVLRGGCWVQGAEFCRSACRRSETPHNAGHGMGFRPVKSKFAAK